ncbi:MAG: hypothetical protein IPP56_15100 [Bacteroidetes bacterium]|nr:hypothetical protein [Bacteroidota bacterium]MBK9672916.1 hypothetical protein [Bacteroidota bacterium]MBK9800987.1 hypothetical protein [Bacteroidota bacterium]MBP6413429.1 hypothetical protein [Bacteroidia bacterium]
MLKIKRSFVYIALLLLGSSIIYSCVSQHKKAASKEKPLWIPMPHSEIKQSKDSLPSKFVLYKLNEDELRKRLVHDSVQLKSVIDFPLPDSSFRKFSVIEVQVMSPALAAKYPAFKTYEGIELANPANRIRMDLNDKNFHGYFMTDQGEFFIAPVDGPDKNLYMVFKKENAPFQKLPFENMQR